MFTELKFSAKEGRLIWKKSIQIIQRTTRRHLQSTSAGLLSEAYRNMILISERLN
jgi:hypothetical protein